MPGTREIRRRIKSVRNTGKITRAMEMISSVKMRKASAAVVALRPYAERTVSVLLALSRARDIREKVAFLSERPVKRALFLVITSNRGLCGSFNTQVLRRLRGTIETLRAEYEGAAIEFVSIGRKGDQGLRLLPGDIVASFSDVAGNPSSSRIRSVATFLFDGFEAGKWDRVSIVYTDFVSALAQKPRVRQVLPFFARDAEEELAEMGDGAIPPASPRSGEALRAGSIPAEYAVEPSPERVLRTLLFRLVETQILHALLESRASEEAARMVAMRNATDAAKEMAENFTLDFNQLRQAKVTQEIAELSAGMAAVA